MPVSKRLRFEILRRDQHSCRYCGARAPTTPLRVDHVVPVALGGNDHPDNLVTSCEPCNNGKSSSLNGTVADATDGSVRPRLTADLADELTRLWVDAYQVHHAGEPPIKLIDEVREAVRDGIASPDLLALTSEAFGIWRSCWHSASNCTEWPDMPAIQMFETSVEIAVDAGADRTAILRAASAAGWAQTPALEQHNSDVAELVGDF